MIVSRWVVLSIISGMCSCMDFVPAGKVDPSMQVKTKNGIVQGSTQKAKSGTTFYSFRGIPFGKPPINKLRFRAPQPSEDWQGVLDATKDGPSCIQLYIRLSNIDNVNLTSWGSEDCLTISVYSPKNPHEVETPLPVMVWIYGGAFIEGTSEYSVYGPDHLLDDRGVMIVTFNYRLGAFGFLSTGDLEAPGNYGLKDQVLALKWVKSNIRAFGGDPRKVTIFGESAGAASVLYLMMSPKGEGLFQRAIAESGSSICGWAVQRNPRKVAFDMVEALKTTANNSKELMTKLRNVQASKLQDAQVGLFLVNLVSVYSGGLPFAPVIEPDHPEAFFTKDNFKSMQNGAFSRVPLIMGLNSNEASIYLYRKNIDVVQSITYIFDLSPQMLVLPDFNLNESSCIEMNLKFPDSCQRQVGIKIRNHFFDSGSFLKAQPEEIINFFTQLAFYKPIIKTAEIMSDFIPIYFYEFTYEGLRGAYGVDTFVTLQNKEKGLGPAHSEEMWYLFREQHFGKLNKMDRVMSQRLVRMWTNFAKFGNPTPAPDKLLQNIVWPQFNDDGAYLKIDKTFSVENNLDLENRQFWEGLYKMHSRGPTVTY